MIMFPCGMISTKVDIKQNYTDKLSLIDRNNYNKNPNELLKSFHLDFHVYNTILTMQGIFSKH